MRTQAWLAQSTKRLEECGVPTARLDCLVLLEDATGKERSFLLAHPEIELDPRVMQTLDMQIERRTKHEPLAYIRGKSEFYGREFMVTANTLQPRPETETMIELARQVTDNRLQVTVADIGTGSGCIAITLKLELQNVEAIGTDISAECIKIAQQNAKRLDAKVAFYKGNLLEPLKDEGLDVLLCNLPYVPDNFTINQAAMQEPDIAIFGGVDGLDYYRELFEQIQNYKLWPKYILTESLPFQHHALAIIGRKYGYNLEKTEDFIQVFSN